MKDLPELQLIGHQLQLQTRLPFQVRNPSPVEKIVLSLVLHQTCQNTVGNMQSNFKIYLTCKILTSSNGHL